MSSAYLETAAAHGALTVSLKNDWVFGNVGPLRRALSGVDPGDSRRITFQCGGLEDIDIAGAWVLFKRSQELRARGLETDFQGFKAAHFKYLQNITEVRDAAELAAEARSPAANRRSVRAIESLGKAATTAFEDVGAISRAVIDGVKRPSALMWRETIRQIDLTGVRAIPIVVLVSFLMGLVLAYQGATQLERFGATIFMVDLVTISILREMGVLMAAIMVAGRSGSSFAASLGVMKLNEEIDALRVIGLNPNQVLIVPRVIALVVALPVLTIVANLAGLAGGLVLATVAIDMSAIQFIERVKTAAELESLLVGLIKAPVFALLIAAVSTLRGMQVQYSAEQLGKLTTVAVVQSIFLIIVADGIFTVIFVRYGI